jgi:succinylglutamate desuccinylase
MNTEEPKFGKKELDMLSFFERSAHEGVHGVVKISSHKPGPVVGITACSHGNEPAGLTAFDRLLNVRDIKRRLVRGDVYLVVNNLAAVRSSKRFIDVDMNRLPADTPQQGDRREYEIVRARELLPIWREFTVGLDIHSTSQDAPPMIISVGPVFHAELVKGFPIEIVITNIDRIQRGKPATGFYGTNDAKVFGIEAGQHNAAEAGKVASICAIDLLINLGMLEGETGPQARYREYKVVSSIMYPDDSYGTPTDALKAFENFSQVGQGTLIARGNGSDIVMPMDGHVIMHNGKARPNDLKNEVLFITEPAKEW